jgi:TolB-like protein
VLRTLVALLVTTTLAHAATPTVAVMPFRDLSGGKGSAGEAIRETVTSDLREVPGLKVIERDRIDQVLVEQNLQARRTDLDAVATVRLGTLLGASLLVAGAYQRAGTHVRLTARVVKVETGEILGTAKVDGASSDFLSLQDKVTVELMRSAGLAAPKFARRPKLKSVKTFELYGDAVLEKDPEKKQKILRAILDDDPDFHYATRDLEAMQKRMTGYGKVSSEKLAAEEQRALSGKLDARAARDLYGKMSAARRFHALEAAASKLFEGKRPELREEALYQLFVARDRLHRFDQALQLGEQFLRDFPTSPRFRDVETRMHEIAEVKKKRAARRSEWEKDMKDWQADHPTGEEHDYAPCISTRWNNQVNELMLTHCSAFLKKYPTTEHGVAARFFIILALAEQGDFDKARPLADKLIADSDEWDEDLRKLMSEWPTD